MATLEEKRLELKRRMAREAMQSGSVPGFVDAVSAENLSAAANTFARDSGVREAVLKSAGKEFLTGLGMTPRLAADFVVNTPAGAAATIGALGEKVIEGKPFFSNVMQKFNRLQETEPVTRFLDQAVEKIPSPTANQIIAAGQTVAGKGQFEQNLAALQEADLRRLENFPVSSVVGTGLGDAAILLLTRKFSDAGARRFMRFVEGKNPVSRARIAAKTEEALTENELLLKRIKDVQSAVAELGVGKTPANILETVPLKFLRKLGYRSTEAGLEAALIANLRDGDPIKLAATAAGSQAAGSMILALANTPRRLVRSIATGAAIIGLYEAFKPGDFSNEELVAAGIDKTIALMSLGAAAGLAGFGRLPKGIRVGKIPLPFLDTAVNRGAFFSVLDDIMKSNDSERIVRALKIYEQDPDALGPVAKRKISNLLSFKRKVKKGEVEKMVDDLLRIPEVRRKFETFELIPLEQRLEELRKRMETGEKVRNKRLKAL